MPSRFPLTVSAKRLLPRLEHSLGAAARHVAGTQARRGARQSLPDARIFETALVAHALAAAGGCDAEVAQARLAVRRMTPQSHHPVALGVETGLRSLLLGGDAEIE